MFASASVQLREATCLLHQSSLLKGYQKQNMSSQPGDCFSRISNVTKLESDVNVGQGWQNHCKNVASDFEMPALILYSTIAKHTRSFLAVSSCMVNSCQLLVIRNYTITTFHFTIKENLSLANFIKLPFGKIC